MSSALVTTSRVTPLGLNHLDKYRVRVYRLKNSSGINPNLALRGTDLP
jgi:hypothetical protein